MAASQCKEDYTCGLRDSRTDLAKSDSAQGSVAGWLALIPPRVPRSLGNPRKPRLPAAAELGPLPCRGPALILTPAPCPFLVAAAPSPPSDPPKAVRPRADSRGNPAGAKKAPKSALKRLPLASAGLLVSTSGLAPTRGISAGLFQGYFQVHVPLPGQRRPSARPPPAFALSLPAASPETSPGGVKVPPPPSRRHQECAGAGRGHRSRAHVGRAGRDATTTPNPLRRCTFSFLPLVVHHQCPPPRVPPPPLPCPCPPPRRALPDREAFPSGMSSDRS
nr:uncharacterized protein LOC113830004 [Penaeus vannamei]